jgi:hypothetical protein
MNAEDVRARLLDPDDHEARWEYVSTVLAELDAERSRRERAQRAIVAYMGALGRNLPELWKDLLVKECGLEIDPGSPYEHPRTPKEPTR